MPTHVVDIGVIVYVANFWTFVVFFKFPDTDAWFELATPLLIKPEAKTGADHEYFVLFGIIFKLEEAGV